MSFRGGLAQVALWPEPGLIPDVKARASALLEDPMEFEGSDLLIEVRVPSWSEPLWFVPTEAHGMELTRTDGVPRGRIWTARELFEARCRVSTVAGLAALVRAKATLDGALPHEETEAAI